MGEPDVWWLFHCGGTGRGALDSIYISNDRVETGSLCERGDGRGIVAFIFVEKNVSKKKN